MPFKKLILVDAMAVVYRAYFAIRDLSTKSGRPTNAIFGFIRMLQQIRNEWSPTHWVVIFDGGLSEEKVALLKEYKAQRPSMPDDLREQIETVEEYLDRAGIAWCRKEGQEADDVLASISVWAEREAIEILVASSDKDMYQVVNDKTKVIPVSGKKAMAMGPAEVQSKTGVSPSQIIEWLALTGDNSDNIQGVPGVGPKTAASLLGEYGSIAGVWDHLNDISRDKLRRSLEESKDIVTRNVKVIRLERGFGCPFAWDDMKVCRPEASRLIPFLEELEFNSMAQDMRAGSLNIE